MTDHKDAVIQGSQAEQAKPVIDRAFDRAKDALTKQLLATSPAEPQAILTLHAAIQGIDAARTAVNQEIGAGKLSQAVLDGEAAMAEQKQR